jgi:hypothetical protein
MRKVILGLGISIDGYIARLNGAVDYSMAPFFATIEYGGDGAEDG